MVGLFMLLARVVQLYIYILIARCILSFVRPNPYNPIVRFIYQITDPLMDAVRRAFPFLAIGGLDLSPIAIIFLLQFTLQVLGSLLLK